VLKISTFLPQDRVASFAMMNHSELLQETEKAAGHVNLSYWHQTLIDEYKAQKEKRIVRSSTFTSVSLSYPSLTCMNVL
jgi:hypothetical protein